MKKTKEKEVKYIVLDTFHCDEVLNVSYTDEELKKYLKERIVDGGLECNELKILKISGVVNFDPNKNISITFDTKDYHE